MQGVMIDDRKISLRVRHPVHPRSSHARNLGGVEGRAAIHESNAEVNSGGVVLVAAYSDVFPPGLESAIFAFILLRPKHPIQRLLNARPLCRVSLSASFRAASAGRFSSEAPVLSVEDDRGRTAIKDGGVSAVYRTGFGIGHRGYQFVFQVLVKRVRQQLTTAIASAGNSLAEPPLITGSANRKQTLCYNNLRNLERSRER